MRHRVLPRRPARRALALAAARALAAALLLALVLPPALLPAPGSIALYVMLYNDVEHALLSAASRGALSQNPPKLNTDAPQARFSGRGRPASRRRRRPRPR